MTDRAPKKIWLRWGRKVSLLPGQIAIKADGDIPYIKEDLVLNLIDFVKEWIDRQGTDENYMVLKARAALAKARGESHD